MRDTKDSFSSCVAGVEFGAPKRERARVYRSVYEANLYMCMLTAP